MYLTKVSKWIMIDGMDGLKDRKRKREPVQPAQLRKSTYDRLVRYCNSQTFPPVLTDVVSLAVEQLLDREEAKDG